MSTPKEYQNFTPLKVIRRHCVDLCMNSQYSLVPNCEHIKCELHKLRHGKSVKGVQPMKQIRKKCIECVNGARKVRSCGGDKLLCGPCPLYTQSRRVLPLKLDESLVNAESFNRSEFY